MQGVIIGSGLGGYNFAKELRKLGYQHALTLITADDGDFYSKPMLSNALTKNKTPEQLVMGNAEQLADQLNIELLTKTRVERIDTAKKQIKTAHRDIPYDQLLLAVGASPRPLLPVNDSITPGLFSINSLSDYRQFRQYLDPLLDNVGNSPVRVGIVGAGLVGCELANDLISQADNGSLSVTLIEPAGRCLATLLPEACFRALGFGLSQAGVQFLYQSVKAIRSVDSDKRQSNKLQLECDHGEKHEFDVVISAIGIEPNTSLAAQAGLAVNQGIVVNQSLQTSDPSIYALGDCAEVNGYLLYYVLPLMASVRAVAKSWIEKTSVAVHYDAMPVVVKTPACPLVISAPPRPVGSVEMSGTWTVEQGDKEIDTKATFLDMEGQLQGFVLSGAFVNERNALKKVLTPLF